MRVLLAAFGTRGDIQPLVALGLELRGRGHQVTVCTPPDYTEWVQCFGLEAHAVGAPFDAFVKQSSNGLAGIRFAMQALPKMIAAQYDAMNELAKQTDVTLGAALTAAGASFAEKYGLQYHYMSCAPCVLPSAAHPSLFTKGQTHAAWVNRLTWWVADQQNNFGLGPIINGQRKKLGLKPVRDIWRHILTSRPIIASDPALGELPSEAPEGTVQTGTWLLPSRERLSPEVTRFLDAGPPPVYVGFGSMPERAPDRATARIFEAVKHAGVRAVISRGAAGLGNVELPNQIIMIGSEPHAVLFSRCVAVMHHGGAGTTAAAARAGVPQLIEPKMTDQFYWRRRVQERGLMPEGTFGTPADLGAGLRVCIEDVGLRDRASAFAAQLGSDGVARGADHLEAVFNTR